MKRREFIGWLAGAAVAAPLATAAEAQEAGRMYRIGFLSASQPSNLLEKSLRELGYIEGRNLVVERRFAAEVRYFR